MNELTRKQKLHEFKKLTKVIERRLKDKRLRAEARVLIHVLIYHFDGFAKQQNLVNAYMSRRYCWGNKRTARVLKTLARTGVISRSRSGPDNWTLFFMVRGFLERCREHIERALVAIRQRLRCFRSAHLSIRRIRGQRSGT